MTGRVIYTAICGDYDKLLEPVSVPENIDFICFTDQDFYSDVWKIRPIEVETNGPRYTARKYKILAHRFLGGYEESVWVDGNITVRGDINEAFDTYLSDTNMAVYDHAYTNDSRSSVKEEFQSLLSMAEKEKKFVNTTTMKAQMQHYNDRGFPDEEGLISSMIMFRRHNKDDVTMVMEEWWEQIKQFSERDQLSFNYAAWKHSLDFSYIREDSRSNKYFKHNPHLRNIPLWKKLIRQLVS